MVESVAQDQLRSIVDRILRMREEDRAIKDDIREIYAEAKGNGFDKTVIGQIVSYIEKDTTDHAALAEREAIFDLYLAAYRGTGTVNANAHTHEAVLPPHNAETGEIIEDSDDRPLSEVVADLREITERHGIDFSGYDPDTRTWPEERDDDQSTAALKEVRRPTGAAHVASEADREIGEVGGRTRALPADTQVPPVDTQSPATATEAEGELVTPNGSSLTSGTNPGGDDADGAGESGAPIPRQRAVGPAGASAPAEKSEPAETSTIEGRPESASGAAPDIAPPSSRAVDAGVPTSLAGVEGDVDRQPIPASPAFTFKPFVLRPHCQHPEVCSGQGREHCFACRQLMEGQAA